MRKHFLILMLLTLLPFSAWADVNFGTIQVGDYTYGDAAFPIPLVKDSEGGSILTEGTHYTVSLTAFNNEDCAVGHAVALEDMKGEGDYWLLITGKNAYAGKTRAVKFNVHKKVATVTVTTGFTRAYLSSVEPAINWGTYVTINDLADGAPYLDTKGDIDGSSFNYTYAGKGKPSYNGGEYPITFSGLSSDCYTFTYTPTNFTITGTDISGEAVSVKAGTAFADKTYKGAKFVVADLTGLRLIYDTDKELVQGTDFDITLTDMDVALTYYTGNQLKAIVTAVDALANDDTALGDANAAAINAVQGTTYTATTTRGDAAEYGTFKTTVGALPSTDDPTTYVKTPAKIAYQTVGAHNYNVVFKGNYSGTKNNFATFNIVQAPLSVDVDDIEVTYKGTAYTNQASLGVAPTFKYYGFVGADVAGKDALIAAFTAPTVAVTQAGGATYVKDGGYALTISGGATPAGSNYTIVNRLNTGKLIINKKAVALKAVDCNKGPADADPAFTLAAYTLGSGDKLDAATITYSRVEGNEVGQSYEITPNVATIKVKKGTKDVTDNYTLTAGTPKGKLTVAKAALTITILDQEKFYGDEDPATIAAPVETTNYIVTGLVKGDEITSVTLTKSWDSENVGNYILTGTVVNTGTEHYDAITVVPGVFSIKKAPLTVTLPIKNVAANITYAAAGTLLTNEGIVITGFKKNEDKDAVADYDLALKDEAAFAKNGGGNLDNQAIADGYTLTLKPAIFNNYAIKGGLLDGQAVAGKLIVGTGNPAALALDANADMFATITAANGETRDVQITLRRNQSIGGKAHGWAKAIWNCMVLPFEASARQISNALGYAIINVVDPANTTENNVKFKLEMLNTIPANTPFFVKTDVDLADGYVANFDGVTIVAPETAYPSVKASNDKIGYNFVGAYDKYVIGDGKDEAHLRWRFGDADKWNKIANGSAAKWNIVPFNAYMDLGATVGAREIVFTFEELDGSTTAVRSIDVETADSLSGNNAKGVYNLNGMKMNSVPTQKGVYIVNGKKVVIK